MSVDLDREKHTLAAAVTFFTQQMIVKLWRKADEGWRGWHDRRNRDNVIRRFREHSERALAGERGQWTDVANLAMMLDRFERGEQVIPEQAIVLLPTAAISVMMDVPHGPIPLLKLVNDYEQAWGELESCVGRYDYPDLTLAAQATMAKNILWEVDEIIKTRQNAQREETPEDREYAETLPDYSQARAQAGAPADAARSAVDGSEDKGDG